MAVKLFGGSPFPENEHFEMDDEARDYFRELERVDHRKKLRDEALMDVQSYNAKHSLLLPESEAIKLEDYYYIQKLEAERAAIRKYLRSQGDISHYLTYEKMEELRGRWVLIDFQYPRNFAGRTYLMVAHDGKELF